jgi:hypothetical protein
MANMQPDNQVPHFPLHKTLQVILNTLQLSRHFCVFNSLNQKNINFSKKKKFSSHLEVLGTRRVTRSKFRTDDPITLGATVQNLVATATWCPRFVHP